MALHSGTLFWSLWRIVANISKCLFANIAKSQPRNMGSGVFSG
jgi:hypothetical protein